MSYVTQQVVLSGPNPHGRRLPPSAVGQAIVAIPNLVRQSVDMAFRGQSAAGEVTPNGSGRLPMSRWWGLSEG